ncbi:MAG: MFS transporter, partial [Chromatocurvus sp.]
WPRASVSLVLLIVSVAGMVSFPIIGRIIDRYGARWVIFAGTALFAAAVAMAGSTEASRLQFYLAYACIGVTAAIPSNVMFTKVIAGWFFERRGLALGIAGGLGNGVGAALSPLLAHFLISEYGWRAAYRGLGATIALVALPVLFMLLRDPPRGRVNTARQRVSIPASDAGADGPSSWGLGFSEAVRSRTFWLILVAIGVGAGCMTAVFAHVVPMLTDRGLSVSRATAVLATFSIVTALWQIGVGYSLDRFARPWIAAPFFLIAVVGLLVLETATNFTLLILAGALMGLGLGTEFAILPYFVSRYFGVAHYGVISGTLYGVVLLLQGLSPYLMGLAYDTQGSYGPAVPVIVVGLAFSALLILRLPRFPALRLPS